MKKSTLSATLSVLGLLLSSAVFAAGPAEIPLPLTGPAYLLADDAYKAYQQGDYRLAIDKVREAIRLRPDVARLKDLLRNAEAALAAPVQGAQPAARRPTAKKSAQQAPSDPAHESAETAYSAYDRHDYSLAVRSARDAVGLMPDNPAYRLLLVNALIADKQFDAADQAISEALQQTGSSKELSMQRVALHRELGAIAETSAYQALERSDVSAAIGFARKAVIYAPADESYRVVLAQALLLGEEFDDANRVASDAQTLNEHDAAPLVLRAYARQRLGQRAAASAEFDLALQKPGTADARRNVRLITADAALAANEPQKALDVLASFGNLDDAETERRRRAARHALKRPNRLPASTMSVNRFPVPAIDCSAKSEHAVCQVLPGQPARDPGFAIAAQAYSAFQAKDYDTAIAKTQQALALSPHNRNYQLLLVNAALSANRLDEAERAASLALAEDDDDAALLAQRGYLRQRLGKPLLAQEDFSAALNIGDLPLALEIGLLSDLGRKQQAWHAFANGINTGAFNKMSDLELAYLATRVGDDDKALAGFIRADHAGKLPDTALADAAFSAVRSGHDKEAITYFKRTIDAAGTLRLRMSPQLLFDTRRAVATVSRQYGVIASVSRSGQSAVSGTGPAPGASGSGALQTGVEAYWRPFGYQNGRTVEIFGRAFETLQDHNGGATGAATMQGTVGARWKVLSDENIVLSFGRLIPIGSQSTSDWLAQAAYSSGKGTDLRVDVPSWWTAQWFGEVGRYFQHPQTYATASAQVGRSFRLDAIDSRLVLFPYLTLNADYNSLNAAQSAVGAGPGINFRYWFREDMYNAPRSTVDLSLQYRLKVQGDDRARGFFMTTTLSY